MAYHEKFPDVVELFSAAVILGLRYDERRSGFSSMIKDYLVSERRTGIQPGRTDDGLGTNSDIGSRLKALYGSIQEESVPDHLLDLLEKLDSVEQVQPRATASKSSE